MKKKLKKPIKIITAVSLIALVICASVVPCFAYTAFDSNTVGEVADWGWGIMPLNFVGIDFSVGKEGGSGYNSRYIYDITPTSYLPDDFFESYNNVALGQYGLHETLSADATADRRIVYDSIMQIKPRTLTDYTTSPTFDYNSIEYRYTFNPIEINITGVEPDAVANNFYIRMSDFFIDLSDNSDRQPYHYMVSTQTNNNNLINAQLSVQYDIVVPYSEVVGDDVTFGFKIVKTVNRSETLRANTGYSIISPNDFTKEEIIDAIGEYGDRYIDWDYVMISNISINMYTKCSYYYSATSGETLLPPSFTYTITCPEYPSYSFSDVMTDAFLISRPNVQQVVNPNIMDWLFEAINDLMNVEIVPYITLGGLIWFIVGIGLIFVVLKIFMGG